MLLDSSISPNDIEQPYSNVSIYITIHSGFLTALPMTLLEYANKYSAYEAMLLFGNMHYIVSFHIFIDFLNFLVRDDSLLI